jgi:hypothetical protein
MIKFRIFAEHIESLAKSANLLPDTYETELKEFLASEEYQKEEASIKGAKLANKKMSLVLKYVFQYKGKGAIYAYIRIR